MFNAVLSKRTVFLAIYYLFVLIFFVFLYLFFNYQLLENRLLSLAIFIVAILIIPPLYTTDLNFIYQKMIKKILILAAAISFILFLTNCPELPQRTLLNGETEGVYVPIPYQSTSKREKITKFFFREWNWSNMCLKSDYGFFDIFREFPKYE